MENNPQEIKLSEKRNVFLQYIAKKFDNIFEKITSIKIKPK